MEKELIKFEQTDSAIPFIKVKHNNITFNLVVDSGCSTSCIDNNILDLLVYNNTNYITEGMIFGDGGHDNKINVVEIPITIGDTEYKELFNAVDLKEMTKQVKDTFGITIRGLLGSDFMYAHGLVLDFKNKLIRYTDGNQTSIDFGPQNNSEAADQTGTTV